MDVTQQILGLLIAVISFVHLCWGDTEKLKHRKKTLLILASIAGVAVALSGFFKDAPATVQSVETTVREASTEAVSTLSDSGEIITRRVFREEISPYLNLQQTGVDSVLEAGLVYAVAGQYEKSISSYREFISSNQQPSTEQAKGYFYIGYVFSMQKEDDSALVAYDMSIELDSTRYQTWSNRGLVLERQGHLQKAIESHLTAIGLDSTSYGNWNNLGVAYSEAKQSSEAIECFDRAIVISPDKPSAWNNRAISLWDAGRLEGALASYDSALVRQPDICCAWAAKGMILAMTDSLEAAKGCYEQAVAADRCNADIRWGLAHVLRGLKRNDEALEQYTVAIALDPEHSDSWLERGETYAFMGELKKALNDADSAIASSTTGVRVWRLRAEMLGALGRHDEAIDAYDRVLALDSNDIVAWNNRGLALSKLDRNDDAAASFAMAVHRVPQNPNLLCGWGSALLEVHMYEEALDRLDNSLRLQSDQGTAWYLRAVALYRLNRNDDALLSSDSAIKYGWGEVDSIDSLRASILCRLQQ